MCGRLLRWMFCCLSSQRGAEKTPFRSTWGESICGFLTQFFCFYVHFKLFLKICCQIITCQCRMKIGSFPQCCFILLFCRRTLDRGFFHLSDNVYPSCSCCLFLFCFRSLVSSIKYSYMSVDIINQLLASRLLTNRLLANKLLANRLLTNRLLTNRLLTNSLLGN